MVRCQNGFSSNRCDEEDANDDDGAIAADGGALSMLPLAVAEGGGLGGHDGGWYDDDQSY